MDGFMDDGGISVTDLFGRVPIIFFLVISDEENNGKCLQFIEKAQASPTWQEKVFLVHQEDFFLDIFCHRLNFLFCSSL